MSRCPIKNFGFLILFIAMGIFVSFGIANAQSYVMPGVYVTDLSSVEVKNNQISGNLTIWNSEKYYMPDISYEIKLFDGTDFYKMQLVDVVVPSDVFVLGPNEKVTKSFTYTYPKNINSGDYTLRVQIITGRGMELDWRDQVLHSLTGANKFLDLNSSSFKLSINSKDFIPLEGPTAVAGDKINAVFTVKNVSSSTTNVKPQIKIFKRMFNMPLVQQYNGDSVSLSSKASKELNLSLPNLTDPESYLAEIKFYNQNNEQVSGIAYFRWVVKGEGAKILFVKADKNSYKAGEKMLITADYVGPADQSNLNGATIKISVYDQKNNLVGQASRVASLGHAVDSFTAQIASTEDFSSPKVTAVLTHNGNVLDSRNINFYNQPQKTTSQTSFKKISLSLYYLIGAVFIVVILVIIVTIVLTKRRKK